MSKASIPSLPSPFQGLPPQRRAERNRRQAALSAELRWGAPAPVQNYAGPLFYTNTKKKTHTKAILDFMSACFVPLTPALAGAGVLKGLLILAGT